MRITRQATKRGNLTSDLFGQIELKAGINVEAGASGPVVTTNGTGNDGKTVYEYKIYLTVSDVISLIGAVSKGAMDARAKVLREHLAKYVPELVEVLALATGTVLPSGTDDGR